MKKILFFGFWMNICFGQNPQTNFYIKKYKTYCNPIDINYQYNWEQVNDKISYRSGADPVVVNFKGEYYLFHTIQGGYWKSKDLLNWQYIVPNRWPMEDMCAPAAWVKDDSLFLFQSTFQQRPIFYSTQPQTGKLSFYNRWLPQLPKDIGPWDPALFYDDTLKSWYMYWGSSNVYPLFGSKLNSKMSYEGHYKPLLFLDPKNHGWERFGQDHTSDITPFMEGAWMTKHKNQYYLQYGAPGTEFNVYGNGVYTASHPLGPFTYAPYNPVAYKPGGFMQGMGHGCTFKDNFGNYWNMGTPWVAINWNFERRIDMVPAGFDADGQMFADTRFADFPHKLPTQKWKNKNELFTGWMLLSYKKPTKCSSVKDEKFGSNNITDENIRTFWVAKTNKAGEWLSVDLEKVCTVNAIQINYADYQSDIYDSALSKVFIQYKIYASEDGKSWQKITDNTHEKQDRPNAYIELSKPIKTRFIRFENIHVPMPNLAVSDIRIFGNGGGKSPQKIKNFSVKRDADTRNAFVKWDKIENAVGYNILWGIAPTKLNLTYQIWADAPAEKEIRALTVGQKYYFSIEAFNENGVGEISEVIAVE